jgi:hypothetical protein
MRPARTGGGPVAGHAPIPFGLIDLPGLQRQQSAVIDLDACGHLMAAGAPRSGRSQLPRTLAAAACLSCAVVTRTQDERAARLLARLACRMPGCQCLAEQAPLGVDLLRRTRSPNISLAMLS